MIPLMFSLSTLTYLRLLVASHLHLMTLIRTQWANLLTENLRISKSYLIITNKMAMAGTQRFLVYVLHSRSKKMKRKTSTSLSGFIETKHLICTLLVHVKIKERRQLRTRLEYSHT